jgi:hypothetical protein
VLRREIETANPRFEQGRRQRLGRAGKITFDTG